MIQSRVERHAELSMIIILQGDKPEGLHTSFRLDIEWLQHFGHAADRARSGLKGDFHKISRRKLPRQLQQTSGHRNGLKLGAGAMATICHDGGCNRTIQFDSRRTLLRIAQWEMRHNAW